MTDESIPEDIILARQNWQTSDPDVLAAVEARDRLLEQYESPNDGAGANSLGYFANAMDVLNSRTPEAAAIMRWWMSLCGYDSLVDSLALGRGAMLELALDRIADRDALCEYDYDICFITEDIDKRRWGVERLLRVGWDDALSGIVQGPENCPSNEAHINYGPPRHIQDIAREASAKQASIIAAQYPNLVTLSPHVPQKCLEGALSNVLYDTAYSTKDAVRAVWEQSGNAILPGIPTAPELFGPPVWGQVRQASSGPGGLFDLHGCLSDGVRGEMLPTSEMATALVLVCWPGAKIGDARKTLDALWPDAKKHIPPRPGKKGKNDETEKEYDRLVGLWNHYCRWQREHPSAGPEAFIKALAHQCTDVSSFLDANEYWPTLLDTAASGNSSTNVKVAFYQAKRWLQRS